MSTYNFSTRKITTDSYFNNLRTKYRSGDRQNVAPLPKRRSKYTTGSRLSNLNYTDSHATPRPIQSYRKTYQKQNERQRPTRTKIFGREKRQKQESARFSGIHSNKPSPYLDLNKNPLSFNSVRMPSKADSIRTSSYAVSNRPSLRFNSVRESSYMNAKDVPSEDEDDEEPKIYLLTDYIKRRISFRRRLLY